MDITTVGIDLAKRIFALHGTDIHGNECLRRTLRRDQLIPFFTRLQPCLVGMEACGSAHYWARQLTSLGHTVKLIAPQFVKPYVKGNKHDAADAAAICEAVTRPSMRFVPLKTPDAQAVLALHRVRQGFVKARTAQGNQLRGLLAEFGLITAMGFKKLIDDTKRLIADDANELPVLMRDLVQRLLSHLLELDGQIAAIERQILQLARHSEVCRTLQQIPGVGPITATAIAATVAENIHAFQGGRHLAAFLGLVPKQSSSGGKERMLGISKRGDGYLRQLLIHGARAVLRIVVSRPDRKESWLAKLAVRRNMNVACVAQANKTARIIWAVLAHGTPFRSSYPTTSAG